MTKNQKQNTRKKPQQKGSSNFPPVPRPDLIWYKGKIPVNNAESGTLVTLRGATQLTTGAGGQVLLVENVDVTAYDNFSEYSTVFQEYRVLGVRYEYHPNNLANTTAFYGGLLVHSILHTAISPTPGTASQAFSYGDAKVGSAVRPFTREWRMTEVDEAKWLDVTNSGTHKGIMLFLDQATAAYPYGVLFKTALVQFRTTRM